MTTFVYNNAQQSIISGAWLWPSLAVNAALITKDYVPVQSSVNLSDIPSQTILTRDKALTALFVSPSGVYGGTIPQFFSLVSPYASSALVLYVKGSDDAHSPLIYYSDDGFGFPFVPQGFNYYVAYDLSKGGFFKLVTTVDTGHIITEDTRWILSTLSGLEIRKQ